MSKTKLNIKLALTKSQLVEKVYALVRTDNLTYIEAVVEICDEYGIDYYDVVPLIKGPLRTKIELEGMKRGSLPDESGSGKLIFE